MRATLSDADASPQDLHDDPPRAHALVRFGALFHKAEIAYVLVTFGLVTWHILGVTWEMIHFAVLWAVICAASAVVALWPRTPRVLHFLAEIVLLVLAVGQLIGPHADVLPILGREIKGAPHWNQIPQMDRRILAWNILSAFALTWLMLPAFLFGCQSRPRGAAAWFGNLIVFLIIWGMLGLLFIMILRSAFF